MKKKAAYLLFQMSKKRSYRLITHFAICIKRVKAAEAIKIFPLIKRLSLGNRVMTKLKYVQRSSIIPQCGARARVIPNQQLGEKKYCHNKPELYNKQ